MIWDLYQQWKIEHIDRESRRASENSRRADSTASSYASRTEQMALAMEAVWSLLKEKHNLTDLDLIQKMHEIDLQDGVKDGKTNGVAISCLGCGQKINTRMKKCIYCDTENSRYSPFVG